MVGGTPESCKTYASRKPPYKIHEDLRWGGWSVQENFQYISVLYDIFMYGGYRVLDKSSKTIQYISILIYIENLPLDVPLSTSTKMGRALMYHICILLLIYYYKFVDLLTMLYDNFFGFSFFFLLCCRVLPPYVLTHKSIII